MLILWPTGICHGKSNIWLEDRHCISLCLSASLPVCFSAWLLLCQSASLPVCFSACLPLCMSASLPVCSLCLSASLPVCLSACLLLCLSASLPVCFSASLQSMPVCFFALLLWTTARDSLFLLRLSKYLYTLYYHYLIDRKIIRLH